MDYFLRRNKNITFFILKPHRERKSRSLTFKTLNLPFVGIKDASNRAQSGAIVEQWEVFNLYNLLLIIILRFPYGGRCQLRWYYPVF